MIDIQSDEHWMREAMRLAQKAASTGEVPVGAVIVHEGQAIGRAFNQVETLKDATAHAEMLALTQAQSVIGDWRLTESVLYVTKEPCPMCAGAIVHCRIKRVVFGVSDEKAGACGGAINLLALPGLNHRCEITPGVRADESKFILQDFFRQQRAKKSDSSF
ncbi:MAG: tRNA adenosine(34) deaminase TadA [Verrucomicrobiota bacterium]